MTDTQASRVAVELGNDPDLGGTTAVIYVRVSTNEQAERDGDPEGYSIPAQREACIRCGGHASPQGTSLARDLYVHPCDNGQEDTALARLPHAQQGAHAEGPRRWGGDGTGEGHSMSTVLASDQGTTQDTGGVVAARPPRLTTTLYALLAAMEDVVDPDDRLIVATVKSLLRAGRLTWCGQANACRGPSRYAAPWGRHRASHALRAQCCQPGKTCGRATQGRLAGE